MSLIEEAEEINDPLVSEGVPKTQSQKPEQPEGKFSEFKI